MSVKLNDAIFYYNKNMGFGENLHNELVYQDIQIKELAARTGIKKSTLDKYLSGKKSQPNVENAVKIADTLGVTVEYLVKGEEISSDNKTILTTESRVFINQYNQLSNYDKQTIKELTQSFLKRSNQ